MSRRTRLNARCLMIASVLCCLTIQSPHLDAADQTLDWACSTPTWLESSVPDSLSELDPFVAVEHDIIRSEHVSANSKRDKLSWYDMPLYDHGAIVRAQSPDSCGSLAEGCCYGEEEEPCFRLTEFNIYPTFSYLNEFSGTYVEFEFASITNLGALEMENRTVMNVADLPGTIALGPTNPRASGGPTAGVRGNGYGDILSGFFFSPNGSHESSAHIGIGPVLTFPTASNQILGSSQYTAGPGIHASGEFGKLTAGFFLWQSWGFDEDPGQKKINQLFGKPFFLYELSEKWDVVYVPLGLSYGWKKPSGANTTIPVGGGLRRKFTCHGQKMGFQMQAFDYVVRKDTDPEWELRFTIEFLFDD